MNRRLVQDAIDRYRSRMPGAREAQLNDPQYAHNTAWLQRMLEIADMAMEDEQIPEQSRARVIRTILYGSPDETEALTRIEERAAYIEALASKPDTWGIRRGPTDGPQGGEAG